MNKRKKLALKIFLAICVFNIFFLLIFFYQGEAPEKDEALPQDHLELKIRGTLYTTPIQGKSLRLINISGTNLGPATFLRLEEDLVVVSISKSIYQHYYKSFAQEEWSLVPYIEIPLQKGSNYEIAY
jgi:hypothetical protein